MGAGDRRVPEPVISKSRYIAGLQCPKLLWHIYNARDLLPPVDAATQAVFDQGHEVGLLAQRLFPSGITIEGNITFDEVERRSRELLGRRVPLFEAGFRYGHVVARADVLAPARSTDDAWDLIEVKSATSLSDIYLDDLAIQRYCYDGAGLRIRRTSLMHLDNAYVKQGAVDPSHLFIRADVTPAVEKLMKLIERRIVRMLRIIESGKSPEVEIGPQCSSPYPCPLIPVCWKDVRETKNSIFDLARIGAKAWPLYRQGVRTTADIPAEVRLSRAQKIQVNVEKTGTPHVNRRAARKFLSSLRPPLHYLDFETFQAAVPVVDGTRPWQQVPFQFSLHVAASSGSQLEHHGWIWDGKGDPRRALLEELRPHVREKGSIIAYGAAFEKARLSECAQAHPELAGWVQEILGRVVDLLAPFRSFAVYYPSQSGGASMKRVLPALTGKGYKDLAIQEGGQASREFARVTFGNAGKEERQRVLRELEEYCGLDTKGMADIVQALEKLTGRG
jgi:hypothetical protein